MPDMTPLAAGQPLSPAMQSLLRDLVGMMEPPRAIVDDEDEEDNE